MLGPGFVLPADRHIFYEMDFGYFKCPVEPAKRLFGDITRFIMVRVLTAGCRDSAHGANQDPAVVLLGCGGDPASSAADDKQTETCILRQPQGA